MNINDIKIPVPFQISMDDIGWIEGRTPYWENFQPTRTGIPRRHTIDDYKIINEIGRSVNMKFCTMFVLGDWDRKGILSKIPYSNRLGNKWTGSPYINIEEQEEIRDYLNSCEYIEMAVHGLMHECWNEDGEYMSAEFVPPRDFKLGNERVPAPEWYMRQHLDGFMEIYNDWGFTQNLRAFTCPGHCFDAWKDGSFTKVLKDYGIKYWQEPYIDITRVDNGVMLNKETGFLGFWEAYDLNPDKLPTYTEDTAGIICSHWPNFLRYDPELNFEKLDKWTAFFKRQAEVFGIMLSRDTAFAHKQLLHKNHCVLTEEDGKIKIDFTKVDKVAPTGFEAPLYISVRNDVAPFECVGATITEYESHKEFKTYCIERSGEKTVYLRTKE
ncbi:MAG: hypothetical protein J6B23_01135 [Clostridia bacterium]|nr:hypothetical protein [Clostridia bacterium]